MNLISKLQPVFIIIAGITGIVLGQNHSIASVSTHLIELFLMFLLFFIFLGIEIKDITNSFSNIKFSISSLIINFMWTPIIALILGKVFLSNEVDLQIGLLMLLVTPCTDWYLIFTGMSKGNIPLASSILPLNLILQIILLPVYLYFLMGSTISFDIMQIVYSIVIVLVIPLTVATIMKWILSKSTKGASIYGMFKANEDNIQLVVLCLAVVAMFASQGELLVNNPSLFLMMLIPLILFFVISFAVALLVGKSLKMPYSDRISLLFTTSARNSPISLAIATVTFPDRPVISLALVIGPLIELPILSMYTYIVQRIKNRIDSKSS